MRSLKFLSLLLLSVFSACNSISSISGYVYDFDTGKPLRGAFVKFYSKCESRCNNIESSSLTDEKGRYELDLKKDGLISGNNKYIEIKKQGYVTFYDSFNTWNDSELSIYLKEKSHKEL